MTRVYVDMVGDLFHVGHLNIIKRAKDLGDTLIVGVHSDATVESYKRKPIVSEHDRYEMIRSCRFVNEVIEEAPLLITEEYIEKHRIDLVVSGDKLSTKHHEMYAVPIRLGIMRLFEYTPGVSTSSIIEKISEIISVIQRSE